MIVRVSLAGRCRWCAPPARRGHAGDAQPGGLRLGPPRRRPPDTGEVIFERGRPRRFDVIIGADGLHSTVRRLVFGDESRFTCFLGAYLAVASMSNYLGLDRRMLSYLGVGRLAAAYSARHLDDARAVFLFRTKRPLEVHYRDSSRQKQLLREVFADLGGEVSRWLEELDRSPAFYFDAITQLRMDSWSRGRVTLVGDAGYCPGPAVGGSTSLAVVGAYVLAGELAEARADHERAFLGYEREISDYVRGSRGFAVRTARTLIPARALRHPRGRADRPTGPRRPAARWAGRRWGRSSRACGWSPVCRRAWPAPWPNSTPGVCACTTR
jgi:2-polyprenyl-6-methoxyphenol hydroxylase-like FAD-dependent oxidoreductase